MTDFTSIQTLGLICLIVFSGFVLIVLFLECMGRFHCSLKRKKGDKDIERQKASNNLNKLCCRSVGVSSGMGCKCWGTLCYCCWKQDIDVLQVFGLPKSRTMKRITHHQHAQDKSCAICLDNFSDSNKRLLALDCRHEFHTSCIIKWLKHSHRCPLCNQDPSVDVIVETNSLNSCEHIFISEQSISSVSHV